MSSSAKMEPTFHPLKNLPGCMLPDGGECCAEYTALADDWHKQREAMKGATIAANIAGSLLKEKDARIADLVKALEECAAPYSTNPGSVNECAAQIHHEFQRRLNIAATALSYPVGREELKVGS